MENILYINLDLLYLVFVLKFFFALIDLMGNAAGLKINKPNENVPVYKG